MCGICGIVDNSGREIKEQLIRSMCARLAHRGPDDEGVYLKRDTSSVGLGHRRLGIIDLSAAGHQPMANEDKNIWLIFNGEVYNYTELRRDLERKGHKFTSHTDCETVIHLYEEYGKDCVKHIRGMFAFALWDEKKKSLFAARDRVGKKPFLYTQAHGRFIFASEFEALLESGFIEKEINPLAVHYYLTFGYIPAPMTIYKNVYKLMHSHWLCLSEGKCELGKYWELNYADKLVISEEEAVERAADLIRDAIKVRLHSDVPLGVFLSGGVDSSAVVALMSEITGARIKTFSIGFKDKDYSELKFARNVAAIYDTDHREFIVEPQALEVLPLLVERYGEPYADSSCIPTYYVANQTKKFVTVALNGDGGDESFAGYERYQAMLASQLYGKFPVPLKYLIKSSAGLLPDSINFKSRLRRIKRFIDAIDLPLVPRYVRWVGMIGADIKERLYSNKFKDSVKNSNPADIVAKYLEREGIGLLDRLLLTDINTNLCDDLMVKADIAAMANSLEGRSPFLDQYLMEFMARVPEQYKMKNLVKKYMLKRILKGRVPSENLNRRKMGFGIPVGKWFRSDLREFVKDNLLSDKFGKRGYFNQQEVAILVKEHLDGRRDHAFAIWTLLMLELWHRRFID